jgi:hypothetical protein
LQYTTSRTTFHSTSLFPAALPALPRQQITGPDSKTIFPFSCSMSAVA